MSDETSQPPPPHPNCAKCGTPMLQGVIVDSNGDLGYWVQGEAVRKFLGLRRIPKGRRYEIITFRCPGCGYLESFTPVS